MLNTLKKVASKMKKKHEWIDDLRGVHDEQAVGYNQAIDDIIKIINQ